MDKEEEEWSKFQSEIKDEAEISEQIQAEDEYINTEERHIKEIDQELYVIVLCPSSGLCETNVVIDCFYTSQHSSSRTYN